MKRPGGSKVVAKLTHAGVLGPADPSSDADPNRLLLLVSDIEGIKEVWRRVPSPPSLAGRSG